MEAYAWNWSGDKPWSHHPADTFFWQKPDKLDPHDPMWGEAPQIYNFDAIDYESISVGMFQIWHGPEVKFLTETKKPKITELQATFSRDGIYYDRPVRGLGGECFIPASRIEGTWNYGYIQSVSGGLIVHPEELWFYFAAFSGKHTKPNGETAYDAHIGGSLGLAKLRRDGFASMDGSGELLTKPLITSKEPLGLFVNVQASGGSLRAELLDENGVVQEGYSLSECIPITENTVLARLQWRNHPSLAHLRNNPFRIRFVQENSQLYSFWLSNSADGQSNGATAAGYDPG